MTVCTLTILVLIATISLTMNASTWATSENSNTKSSEINDSAIEKLAQALQQDKDDGDNNGGKNWDNAIQTLGEEMGFPVDDDVESALLNITEFHLSDISSN